MLAADETKPRLLIVDDEEPTLRSLGRYLRDRYEVVLSSSGLKALDLVKDTRPAVVLLDVYMPDAHGLEILVDIKARHPDVPVLIHSGHGDVDLVARAMKSGAEDFVLKPADLETLETKLAHALHSDTARSRVMPEAGALVLDRATLDTLALLGASPDTTVLISGPTGAGKGALAALIHQQSRRHSGPFIDINCAGLSEALLDSELFGHERGAFTDAAQKKLGMMELADGGTLFLDEIGDMPVPIQAKVLKAFETKQFRRLGGTCNIRVDVRIVAASHVDLLAEVHAGQFREDLYYRLSVMTIELPPLAERREDIPTLAERFAREYALRLGKPVPRLGGAALAQLRAHGWPGNIRELRNVIERACVVCRGPEVTLGDLPPGLAGGRSAPVEPPAELATLAQLERQHIERVLVHTGHNKAAAARLLGINVSTLSRKLARYQDR